MTDSELLQEYLQERSEPAFRELVVRHLGLVYGTALRQTAGDTHLAQDVAQRVFVVLARKAKGLSDRGDLSGWLHTAARLEASRLVRSESRRRERERKVEEMNVPTGDSNEADWMRLVPILDDALGRLDDRDRTAVLQRYFAGKSYAQLGQAVGLNEEAARKRVERAVDRLRGYLKGMGAATSAAALETTLSAHAVTALPASLASSVATAAWSHLGSSAASSTIIFMGMTKVTFTAAIAVVALTAAAVRWDLLRVREAEARDRQAVALEVAGNQQIKELEGQLARRRAAVTAKSAPPVPQADTVRPYLSDPRYQELAERGDRARKHLEFQRLYRQLNLSPDQIRQFETSRFARTQVTSKRSGFRTPGAIRKRYIAALARNGRTE